jgi:exodeoxyribonuclease V alpha subunit
MPAAPEKRRVVIELTSIPCKGQKGFVVMKGKIIETEKPEGIGKSLTCKGFCQELCIGAHYELEGMVKWDEKYNEYQLNFKTYKVNQAATVTGLQNYLAHECDHIGEGRADQIVKLYGDKTWDVLVNEPLRLTRDIVGLNIITAQEIQKWAKQEQELSSVKRDLYESGMKTGLIRKLLEAYGTSVSRKLREECFSLTEVKGIGFLTADRLALKFGMPPTHSERIREGVLYALAETMEDQGHCCIEHHILVNAACKLLSLDKRYIIEAIKQMIVDKQVCTETANPKDFSKYPELFE